MLTNPQIMPSESPLDTASTDFCAAWKRADPPCCLHLWSLPSLSLGRKAPTRLEPVWHSSCTVSGLSLTSAHSFRWEQVLNKEYPVLGRKGSKTRGRFLLRWGDPRLVYETLQLRWSEELSHLEKGRKLSPTNPFFF